MCGITLILNRQWVGAGLFLQYREVRGESLVMRGSRKFRQGGPGQSDKKSSDKFFFFFLVLSLFLRKSNGQFQRNLSFFTVSGGGGGQLFPVAYSL